VNPAPAPPLWTVGHSTRTLEAFVALLRAHAIDAVIDVRTVPRSRRHPHFEKAALVESLPQAGVAYTHMPGLGGLRKPRPDSRNTGLRTEGFRGYADYMETDEFARHVAALLLRAGAARIAAMCAEAQPAQCHRSLLSDALVAHGARVLHITGPHEPVAHILTPGALREGVRLGYPARQGELFG
jgi:uncharacterized protein (DUF488 family)